MDEFEAKLEIKKVAALERIAFALETLVEKK